MLLSPDGVTPCPKVYAGSSPADCMKSCSRTVYPFTSNPQSCPMVQSLKYPWDPFTQSLWTSQQRPRQTKKVGRTPCYAHKPHGQQRMSRNRHWAHHSEPTQSTYIKTHLASTGCHTERGSRPIPKCTQVQFRLTAWVELLNLLTCLIPP
jgi:hypothetical protein